jgi:hypothetical protein
MYWDRFDIVEAHYQFCIDYHGGQWSPEYARLRRIQKYFTPSIFGVLLSENGEAIYANLEKNHLAELRAKGIKR